MVYPKNRKSITPNTNQLLALQNGRKLAYAKESIEKRVLTRKLNGTYKHSEETKAKIKESIKKRFPNGRPKNLGCFKKGSVKNKNPSWKGGRRGWWHKQARRIMEKYIKRKLKTEENVHHIDGDYKNNNISNLQIVSRSEHMKIHHNRGDI